MEPSNTDIIKKFEEHAKNDEVFQDETRLMQAHQASETAEMGAKIDGLATKEDIRELKQFLKNVKIGEGILRFTWNNSAKIGSLAVFLFGIFLLFKLGIAGAISFFFTKH
jgi:hypothetical protein